MRLAFVLSLLLAAGPALVQANTLVLLNVQKGELPGDASAQAALVTDNPEKDGGVSLKVTFGEGSFGSSNPKLKDWKGLRYLKFFVHNPSDKAVNLYLAVRDKNTTGYDTRADSTFTVKPGANRISIDLQAMKRNNAATAVDWSTINAWYFARAEAGPEALYFGDIVLSDQEGAEAAPAAAPAAGGSGAGKKLVLEGRIRIELDNVTMDDLTAVLSGAGAKLAPAVSAKPGAPKETRLLLNAAEGQGTIEIPEGAKGEMSDDHAKELGGRALKVTYTKGEQAISQGSWGAGANMPTNWTAFTAFRFEAFNASDKTLACYLAIRDKKTGYENRADVTFMLKPGLNKVDLPIGTLATNGGGQLDKGNVTMWYMPVDQAATVYFANIRLEKD